MLADEYGARLGQREGEALQRIVRHPIDLNRSGTGERDVAVLAATYAIDILAERPFIEANFPLAIAAVGTFLDVCDHDLVGDPQYRLIAYLELFEGDRDAERFTKYVVAQARPRTRAAATVATYVY